MGLVGGGGVAQVLSPRPTGRERMLPVGDDAHAIFARLACVRLPIRWRSSPLLFAFELTQLRGTGVGWLPFGAQLIKVFMAIGRKPLPPFSPFVHVLRRGDRDLMRACHSAARSSMASVRYRNQCAFRHSARRRPLSASMKALRVRGCRCLHRGQAPSSRRTGSCAGHKYEMLVQLQLPPAWLRTEAGEIIAAAMGHFLTRLRGASVICLKLGGKKAKSLRRPSVSPRSRPY